MLLRPVPAPTADVWDDLLRLARRVEHTTTQTLVRRWAHWVIPAVLTGLLAAIGLNRPGLWTDELATWGMAGTPWSEFWPVLRYVDAVLAPYYVLMHVWVDVFGDSDIALRAPSVLAMAASAGLTAAMGAKLAGRTTGLLTGTVFALLPSTSRFAVEARPYALGVLAAVVATWLLLRALEKPGWPRWAGYAGAVAVLSLLHVVGILLVAAHAWVVLAWRRKAWWPFCAAATVGAAATVPVLILGYLQRNQVSYIPKVTFYTFLPYSEVLFGGVGVALLVILLAMFSLPLRLPSAVFAAWAVVPVAALIVVSLVMPMFLPRYLLYTTPGWALLAGAALARLRLPWAVAAIVALAALAAPAQLQMRTSGGHEHQATRQAALVVGAFRQPGDGIVYADDEPVGSWTARDAITHYLPAAHRPDDVLMTNPPRTAGLLLATECPDVNRCLRESGRLWIVRIGRLDDPLTGIGQAKENVLRQQFQVTHVWYPSGLTVALMERGEKS